MPKNPNVDRELVKEAIEQVKELNGDNVAIAQMFAMLIMNVTNYERAVAQGVDEEALEAHHTAYHSTVFFLRLIKLYKIITNQDEKIHKV